MTESPEPAGRPPRSLGSRYSIMVGLAFLVLIAYVTYNTVTTRDAGVLGVGTSGTGQPLTEFAVPDIRGRLVGDANVFQDDCSSSRNPCPEGDRRDSACDLQEAGVIRVCDFFDRPLAISFWFTRGGDCLSSEDNFDRLATRFPGVGFLSLNVRDERGTVERTVAERGWHVPVGWDRDGAVSNLYRVGVCPTVALAYPGGILRGGLIGSDELGERSLGDSLRELVAESRRRAELVR